MESKRPLLPCNSAEIVGDIDDLLKIIFLFIPARLLIRLQLVSKHWRSLIFAEQFSYLHTLRHSCRRTDNQLSFILWAKPFTFFYFNHVDKIFYPFCFWFSYTRILQSCNGLLLLECKNSPFGRRKYYVCNFTHKKIRELVFDINGYSDKKEKPNSGLCLALDPLKSPHYKVVCVKAKENSRFEYIIEVYDSQNHTWTCLGRPFSALPNTQFCNGIYLNNGIYWIKSRARSYFLDLEKGSVATLPTIRFPRRKAGGSNKNYILESNGHIHCVSLYLQAEMKSVLVFELLEDHSCWIHTFCADLNPIPTVFPEMSCAEVNVLGIVRGDKEEDSVVLLHFNDKIVFYRFGDGDFGLICDLKMPEFGRLQFDRNHVFQLVETLAPV